MGREPLQDVFQVDERIDPMTLSAAHWAIQRSGRPAAPITPDEEEVPSPEGLSSQRPLGEVVVDGQLTVAG
jgi:hypothetical protein